MSMPKGGMLRWCHRNDSFYAGPFFLLVFDGAQNVRSELIFENVRMIQFVMEKKQITTLRPFHTAH